MHNLNVLVSHKGASFAIECVENGVSALFQFYDRYNGLSLAMPLLQICFLVHMQSQISIFIAGANAFLGGSKAISNDTQQKV